MESTLSLSSSSLTLFTISRALNRHFTNKTASFLLPSHLLTRRLLSTSLYSRNGFASASSSNLRSLYSALPILRRRLECVSNYASASFGGTGGGGSFGSGGSGGGGDGGGDSKSKFVAGAAEQVSALSSDVILLDVGGMTCGGCAASVKKILESQPQVSSASVNLTTETAIVWPVSEAKVVPNWQKQLGEELAKHLTNCGFESNVRVAGQETSEGDISP